MRISKLKISLILLTITFPILALAAAPTGPRPFDINLVNTTAANAGYQTEDVEPTTLASVFGTLVFGLLSFLGVVFISLMVYGGYRWLTARGNEQNIEEAKKIIRNSIIGVSITVAAYGIWRVIEQFIL